MAKDLGSTSEPTAIGAGPTEILFVDDNLTNVVGARDAGLRAIHWQIDEGQDTLIDLLANHGVLIVP